MKLKTSYLYPSPLPFSPLTGDELDRRQTHEDGETVVAAANAGANRPRSAEYVRQATRHANLSMAYCEAKLIRTGRYYVPGVTR